MEEEGKISSDINDVECRREYSHACSFSDVGIIPRYGRGFRHLVSRDLSSPSHPSHTTPTFFCYR